MLITNLLIMYLSSEKPIILRIQSQKKQRKEKLRIYLQNQPTYYVSKSRETYHTELKEIKKRETENLSTESKK